MVYNTKSLTVLMVLLKKSYICFTDQSQQKITGGVYMYTR